MVASSNAKIEFQVMAQCVSELLWLKIILEDLKIKWGDPMRPYCDNKSTISITQNRVNMII